MSVSVQVVHVVRVVAFVILNAKMQKFQNALMLLHKLWPSVRHNGTVVPFPLLVTLSAVCFAVVFAAYLGLLLLLLQRIIKNKQTLQTLLMHSFLECSNKLLAEHGFER